MKPLSEEFNKIVLQFADLVRWYPSPDAPEDFDTLKKHYSIFKTIPVRSTDNENTVYGYAYVNMAFRAWHDFCHIIADADFSFEGEKKACLMMQDQVMSRYGDTRETRLYWRLIHAEVIGQYLYFSTHGKYPDNQREFVVNYAGLEEHEGREEAGSSVHSARADEEV